MKTVVAIYQLSRGWERWTWLCPKCLGAAVSQGWEVKESKPAPAGEVLTCDDCRSAGALAEIKAKEAV